MAMKGPDGTNTNLRALNLWWKDKKTDMTVALTSDDNRVTFWSVPNDVDQAKRITGIDLTANNDEYNKVTVYLRGESPGDDVIHFTTTGTPPTKLAGDVHVTVVEVDLDVDTNNDGSIDTANTGEDRYEQYEPGVLVCRTPATPSSLYHHNVPMKLKVDAGGSSHAGGCKVTMEALAAHPSSNLIYTSLTTQNSSTLVTFENSPHPPAATVWYLSSVPATVWILGRTVGSWPIKLICKDPSGNIIKTDTVAIYVVPYVNTAPIGFSNDVTSWCPFWKENEADSMPHDILDTSIPKRLEHHGWDIVTSKFTDEQGDATTGTCTLANLKNIMPYGGVIIMCTHGFGGPSPPDVGSAALVAFAYGEYTDATAWKGSEFGLGVGDMKIGNGSTFVWRTVVYAEPSWFASNWKTWPDSNNALVVFEMCYSDNVLGYVGGRMKFAFHGHVPFSVADSDMNELFGKLTGGSWGNVINLRFVGASAPSSGRAHSS